MSLTYVRRSKRGLTESFTATTSGTVPLGDDDTGNNSDDFQATPPTRRRRITSPEQPREYEWVFRRPKMQIHSSVQLYCKEQIIAQIRGRLEKFGESTYKKFKKSCFRKFLKLPQQITKHKSAIHYVISREMKFINVDAEGVDKTEVSYYINNTRLRFRRFEYALITGLRFGSSRFDPNKPNEIPSNSLYSKIFLKKQVTVQELLNRFMQKDGLGPDEDDYVKAAKILFVYQVLFGIDLTKTKVAEWIWALVENDKAWNKFPWGSASYQKLLKYITAVKEEPTGTEREGYHLYGCTIAFMAWIFCAIPNLGEKLGIYTYPSSIPRMLIFSYGKTKAKFSEIEIGEVQPTLEPNEVEAGSKYWLSIEPEGTPFGLQLNLNRQNYSKQSSQQINQVSQQVPLQHGATSSGQGDSIFSFAWSNKETFIDEIGKKVCSMLRNDKEFLKLIGEHAALSSIGVIGDNLPRYVDYMRYRSSTSNANLQEQVNVDEDVSGVDNLSKDLDPLKTLGTTDWARDWGPTPQYTHTPGVHRKEDLNKNQNCPPKLDFVQVRKKAPAAALLSPFRPFDRRGTDYTKFLRSSTKRNVGIGPAVEASFFKIIADVKKELECCHIDAYIACLTTNPEFAGIKKWDSNVTLTSTSFLKAVHEVWLKYHKDEELSPCDPNKEEKISCEDLFDLSKFVTGALPRWGEIKNWFDFEKVIIVVHMVTHWVTVCVNLKESCLTVYDPTQKSFEEGDFIEKQQFFAPLSRILPQILKYSGFYDAHPEVVPVLGQWKVQQPAENFLTDEADFVSSGAYALKYVEAIFTGKMEALEKKNLKAYRTHLAQSVYYFSTDEDTILVGD